MLVSGVVAGIAAGIAFGGEWRRLNSFTLQLWPLLVIGAGLRLVGELVPSSPLAVYFIGLICIAVVAARNWRLPGAALISVGTFSNVLVVLLNNGMPYDVVVATEINALPPNNGLYVPLGPDTIFPFLADIIPVAFVPVGFLHSVYSVGDFLIAFGGFLIPRRPDHAHRAHLRHVPRDRFGALDGSRGGDRHDPERAVLPVWGRDR